MLKGLRSILLLLTLLGLSLTSRAQHLMLDSIYGNTPFQDTAFENIQFYSQINVQLFNSDSVNFIDTLDIFLRANQKPVDTLYYGSGIDSIPALSFLNFTLPGYHFSPLHYDDGDNIVVIWPAARTVPIMIDTTYTHVYFQSVNGIDEFENSSIKIFPNPATDFIYLEGVENIKVKRVRIIDVLGREYYNGYPSTNSIPVKHLLTGTYFIRLEKANGTTRVICLIKG